MHLEFDLNIVYIICLEIVYASLLWKYDKSSQQQRTTILSKYNIPTPIASMVPMTLQST